MSTHEAGSINLFPEKCLNSIIFPAISDSEECYNRSVLDYSSLGLTSIVNSYSLLPLSWSWFLFVTSRSTSPRIAEVLEVIVYQYYDFTCFRVFTLFCNVIGKYCSTPGFNLVYPYHDGSCIISLCFA